MISTLAGQIVADLRRAGLLLGAVAIAGAVAGVVVAAARPVSQEATGTLLVLSAAGKPFTAEDLRMLVDDGVLADAVATSGLPEGTLASGLWIRGRPELGIFELGFVHGDATAATRGAAALAGALAARIGQLGRLRQDLVLDTGLPTGTNEREVAEAALLAHIEAVGDARPRSGGAGELRGKQRAERERLTWALRRAEERERSLQNLDLRYRVDLAWNSARATVIRPAGQAIPVPPPTPARAALTGGAIALLVSIAGVLLVGASRRPGSEPVPGAMAPDA